MLRGPCLVLRSYNSAEFSGGLISQKDIGVLFRYIHDAPQRFGR